MPDVANYTVDSQKLESPMSTKNGSSYAYFLVIVTFTAKLWPCGPVTEFYLWQSLNYTTSTYSESTVFYC